MYGAFLVAAMAIAMFVLSLIFEALGTSGVSLDYEMYAVIFEPGLSCGAGPRTREIRVGVARAR